MNFIKLRDRIFWGSNRAARIVGIDTDAFRPHGPSYPVDPSNRYLRLPAVFSNDTGDFNQSIGFGAASCRGYFDATYSQAGDYLIARNDIWFIASQDELQPILCVRTNRIASFIRHAIPPASTSSANTTNITTLELGIDWPVSILTSGTSRYPATGLPSDLAVATHQVLLPVSFSNTLTGGDYLRDDLGRTLVVVTAEQSALGWRLGVRDITT
jgi:hypothetical protein